MISLAATAWAEPARITNVVIDDNKSTTRFILEISGAPFHYSWQLSNEKKFLSVMVDNVSLATTLPKLTSSMTSAIHYKSKIREDQASLQLEFMLKTAQNLTVYTLPGTDKKTPSLVIDFGYSSAVSHQNFPVITESKTQNSHSVVKRNNQPAYNKPISEDTKINSYASIMDEQPEADSSVGSKSAAVYFAGNTPSPHMDTSSSSDQSIKTVRTKKRTKKTIMVVIDPGHGGKDSGAIGPDGAMEKNIVLAISRLLQKDINRQPGFQAQLTRNRDVFIPLRQRLYIARNRKADIFIAIHADSAYKNEDAIGASVFALSENGATSEMARWLAQKENSSEFIYGVTVRNDKVLRSVLLDLSQTYTISVSLTIGQQILENLSTITKLHYKRVEQAAFVVLKSPDIPSLLIETGYISNPAQEKKLKDPIYQEQLANAIVDGIVAYFQT